MISKLGYPYSYGDNDSQIELLNLAKIKKIALVALVVPLLVSQPAHASGEILKLASGKLVKKTSIEALRSAAGAGACVMGMTQATKCGDISTATAFACGCVVC